MLSLMFLGFLIGVAHAFEADHLAAVSALVSGERGIGRIARQGAMWGLGHTLTLLIVGGVVLALGRAIPDRTASGLELAVGVMLVGLGAHLLFRVYRDRVHVHRHRHADGTAHFHLHSHKNDAGAHNPNRHRHAHPDGAALRSLAVGVMHGLAGSAALILVTASTLNSVAAGIGYILLFGLGSILGMASISAVIALPLSYTARYLTKANLALQLMIGCLTTGIGIWTIAHMSGQVFG